VENILPISCCIALVLAFVISCIWNIHMGVLGFAFSFIIGIMGGFTTKDMMGMFPTTLFITLLGVNLFFTLCKVNGTISYICNALLRAAKGNRAIIPWIFMLIGLTISATGAGPLATSSLMIGPALAVAATANIDPLLMGIMTVCGSHGGGFSPITGFSANVTSALSNINLPNYIVHIFIRSAITNVLLALVAYFLFGGIKLIKETRAKDGSVLTVMEELGIHQERMTREQLISILAIAALFVGAIGFKLNVGFLAMILSMVLLFINRSNQAAAFKDVPWNSIVLVCGAGYLVNMMDKVGTTALISEALVSLNSPLLTVFIICFIAGLLSAYASSDAVFVTFIPIVAGVLLSSGAAISMPGSMAALCISSTVVDTSPLSTHGSLLVSQVKNRDPDKYFKQLMAWGFAMIPVGSALSWLLYVVFGL
jgi:di/tricarboxylate transporter